jgi:predicted ABC-type ATPase
MTPKPNFTIIAGPNGAGKSTNRHIFVPISTPIFNGDLVLADLIKKYPSIEPLRLHGGVAKALEDRRNEALALKKNFAFESNYSSDMATEITQQFKNADYHTTLVYFGLNSLKVSATRVRERIVLGGHDVTPETMQYNFEESIKRVNKDLILYDTIIFVDTQKQNARIIALIQKGEDTQITLAENIMWYTKYFKEQIEALKIERKHVVDEIRQERSRRGKRFRW